MILSIFKYEQTQIHLQHYTTVLTITIRAHTWTTWCAHCYCYHWQCPELASFILCPQMVWVIQFIPFNVANSRYCLLFCTQHIT